VIGCGEGPRHAVPAGAGGTTITAEVPDNATTRRSLARCACRRWPTRDIW